MRLGERELYIRSDVCRSSGRTLHNFRSPSPWIKNLFFLFLHVGVLEENRARLDVEKESGSRGTLHRTREGSLSAVLPTITPQNLGRFWVYGFSWSSQNHWKRERYASEFFVMFHALDTSCARENNTAVPSSSGTMKSRPQTGKQATFFWSLSASKA